MSVWRRCRGCFETAYGETGLKFLLPMVVSRDLALPEASYGWVTRRQRDACHGGFAHGFRLRLWDISVLDQAAGPEYMLILDPQLLEKVCKYSSLTDLQIIGMCSMRFPDSLSADARIMIPELPSCSGTLRLM